MYSHFSWAAANCRTLHPQNIGIKHGKLTWTQMFSLFNVFGCGFSTRKLDGLQIYTLPFLGGFGWDEMRFLYIISPRQSKRGSINYQQTTNKAPSTMLSEFSDFSAIACNCNGGLWWIVNSDAFRSQDTICIYLHFLIASCTSFACNQS